jgi:hypothetical protein
LGCVANEREIGEARRCESGEALLETTDDNLSHARAAIATRTRSRGCEESARGHAIRFWKCAPAIGSARATQRATVALVPNLLQFACSESTAETIISLSTLLDFRNFTSHLERTHNHQTQLTEVNSVIVTFCHCVAILFTSKNTSL